MQQSYTPSDTILQKYADILVDVGLGNARGIKKGDIVWLYFDEAAKPLLYWTYRKVLQRGGFPVIEYRPTAENNISFEKSFFELAKPHQLDTYHKNLQENLLRHCDHRIAVIAETDKHELEDINPKKIARYQNTLRPYQKLYMDSLANQSITRTVGLYGTDQMAAEAGLTTKQYWNQIIKACFLDQKNPVQKWRTYIKQSKKRAQKLSDLSIESVHVKSKNVDLVVGIGADRKWIAADGDNLPSFEIFTSPDWRQTNGVIYFDMPLYAFGNKVSGIKLEFKDGEVVRSSATQGEVFLRKLLKIDEGASRVGEFSLTDKRYSPINKFMAETLYDENFGGRYGNTHIALGAAYQDCLKADHTKLKKSDFKKRGFNDSAIHKDIFSTENRTVTATLQDGSKKIIYKNGQFTI